MSSKPVLFLRSLLFWIGFVINVVIFGLLIVILFFTPSSFRLKIAKLWSRTNNFLLKIFCGIKYKVEGLENLDVGTAIILCKHQSTWETLALHSFTPYVRWVFKKELMRIPVFGWALALTDPIAINRGAGRVAIKQLINEGTEKLNAGKWMVLFPEGTRTSPGKTHKYKIGGALLAKKSGYPVIPIAHNAGEFWPKHSFIKWPGTISVVIGPAIQSKGRSADEINEDVYNWIESTMEEISDKTRWNR
ncbi:Acyl-CoA:1-acyl-sn-glycerol-3-phosphate acyltransferase [hydrothermal vent metagenome]|uniref:Acyl-CoA:1-acyl-sn-glycerol-3-phosphate acyltransferase n=1 Tax=hydrothermal vent metagenome TaxID=652676 RepID=A0A3B0WKI7_9ZZZZ